MNKKRSQFHITEVPSLDASAGSVGVDIGYLGYDDHMKAFVDIFEKFVHDNKGILSAFESISVEAKKPTGRLVVGLGAAGGVSSLFSNAREVGKELYCSNNDKVKLVLSGKGGQRSLFVTFDNPHFSFG
ncbi:hypothetical protein SVA_0983 [Sulfurifustis variabilis]|uniref:Uncharacterized protein n=1 Tax=Sulfurifustis variabilis TaxID=1675686 RepID=A0A1B4V4U2_9GAMM|nr:hypothetical protein [Sulfurifustis variabilis]BAU47562.1 hypothetical protein SVA_0983 [Sulfurifustis variabilis]